MSVDTRLTTLERVLQHYIESSERNLASLSYEMKVFKDEMKDFKDEMKVFKDEMGDFKDDSLTYRKEMNKQWGSLANKMGSLVEDIITPGIGPALKRYFNTRLDFIGNHLKKYNKESGLQGEFDIVATDENHVYIVEVKSSPDIEKIDYFKGQVIPRFKLLYPEYKSRQIIPIMGSLSFSEKLIDYASKSDVYLLGFREWEYLDILNFDKINTP